MNWRALVEKLAGTSSSPRRTAAAFALGVFLSFSPYLGLQIIIGMSLAFLLWLNRPAVFIGLNANLPWILVPWYTLATVLGGMLLNRPIPPDFRQRFDALMALSFYTAEFRSHALDLLAPFFWSFIVGSTIGAAVLGTAAYFVMAPLLSRWRLPGDAQQ